MAKKYCQFSLVLTTILVLIPSLSCAFLKWLQLIRLTRLNNSNDNGNSNSNDIFIVFGQTTNLQLNHDWLIHPTAI